jgi:hypothetical protein
LWTEIPVECQTWRVASELGKVRGAIVSPRLSSGGLVVEYGETLKSQRKSKSVRIRVKGDEEDIYKVLSRLSFRLFF